VACGDGADAEPVRADEGDSDRDADDGTRGEPVGYRALGGQVHVPALIVVVRHLGLDRELQEKAVQPGHGVLIIARCRGREYRSELGANVSEHVKIAPCHGTTQPVTEGACAGGRCAQRVRLAGSLDGIRKANREVCVRREIH
jgi:hypothetical protein